VAEPSVCGAKQGLERGWEGCEIMWSLMYRWEDRVVQAGTGRYTRNGCGEREIATDEHNGLGRVGPGWS
jgi:hypothetical protein